MFNHVGVELPPVKATNSDGVRLYETPDGNKYPSITTVLSVRNKKGLMEWRKRVGNDVANHVARTAAARGTKVHHMCEDYLNNMPTNFPKEWAKHKKNFLPYCLFGQLADKALCNIDNIYAQEAGLYSDKYKVAGRVDCIAEYNGVPSIIDFKTSTKERKDEWNESYYIQGSAYAEMFGERTGIEISQVVILVVTEDGTVQEFVRDKHSYLDSLVETVTEWREKNEILIATLTVFLLLSSKTLAQDTEPTFVQVQKPIVCGSEEVILSVVKLHNEVMVSAWIDPASQFPVFLYANWEKGTTSVLEMPKPNWLCSLSTGTGAAFIENKPKKGIDFNPATWYK